MSDLYNLEMNKGKQPVTSCVVTDKIVFLAIVNFKI